MSSRLPARRAAITRQKGGAATFIGVTPYLSSSNGAVDLPVGTQDLDYILVFGVYGVVPAGLNNPTWTSSIFSDAHGYQKTLRRAQIPLGGVVAGLSVSGISYAPVLVAVYRGPNSDAVLSMVSESGVTMTHASVAPAPSNAMGRVSVYGDRTGPGSSGVPPVGYTKRSGPNGVAFFTGELADQLTGLPGVVTSPTWTGFADDGLHQSGFLLELRKI